MKPRDWIVSQLRINPKILLIYVILYYSWGFLMNEFGKWAEIATFRYSFQIFTCYVVFMIPVSLVLRKLPWHMQYAYGTVLMGIFEFGGYTFETSVAFDNNIIDYFFNERNFSLAMTLFFAGYFPLGNTTVGGIARWFNLKYELIPKARLK